MAKNYRVLEWVHNSLLPLSETPLRQRTSTVCINFIWKYGMKEFDHVPPKIQTEEFCLAVLENLQKRYVQKTCYTKQNIFSIRKCDIERFFNSLAIKGQTLKVIKTAFCLDSDKQDSFQRISTKIISSDFIF